MEIMTDSYAPRKECAPLIMPGGRRYEGDTPSSRTKKLSFKLLADISGLLRSVTLLAHLTSDTIVQGSTTCLRAPPEPADGE